MGGGGGDKKPQFCCDTPPLLPKDDSECLNLTRGKFANNFTYVIGRFKII